MGYFVQSTVDGWLYPDSGADLSYEYICFFPGVQITSATAECRVAQGKSSRQVLIGTWIVPTR